MTAQQQTTNIATVENRVKSGLWLYLGLFALFLVGGLAIFLFGVGYFELFPTNKNPMYLAGISAVFLAAALLLRHYPATEKYWRAVYALFTASTALLVLTLMETYIYDFLRAFNLIAPSSQSTAFGKIFEMVMICGTVLLLTKLSGADLGSLYISRGNLKLGLSIGFLVFFNLAASSFLFFAERYTSGERMLAALVWGLVFSFANSFMEEVWIRALLLKRLQPLLGGASAVLLTSIIFSTIHSGAVYLTPIAIPFIVAQTLCMGIACGWLMLKTNSLIAAVLIHAGADLFLFIAMLAQA